ncbi:MULTISPECIES: multidrug effflux MFS transporter [Salinicola]|jgi:DHA1 family bicyclomycin/chloramphenicol resistance-like MFS transporter/DHA1 family florfenicol/chloramphenicol resistance protein-like MFS transporter|uniref:multidrug effflux MFS transporter n=1 Tax=Salinicola TaxID=404432 RepID=UPI001C4FBE91|nr:multidrug effflux MFS transporter [Salinicola salarius]
MQAREERPAFWILMGAVMLSPLAIDIYLPALTAMADEFERPYAALQLTITLFLMSVGVGQLLVGPLTDRFGRRPVLLGGVAIYMVAAVIGMAASSIVMLYLSRVLQGLGACASVTVAFAAIRDSYTPTQGAKLYSYLNGSLTLVPSLAPVLGGALTVALGWRSNFAFMTAFAGMLWLSAYWRFGETRPLGTTIEKRLYRWSRYRPVLFHRRFLYYATLVSTMMAAILVYVSAAPVVMMDRLRQPEWVFSLWFGGNALVSTVAFFIVPRLMARWGRKSTVQRGLLVVIGGGALIACLYWAVPVSVITFMGPVAILSIGFSMVLGAAASLALEPFPERAGTAAALLGAIQLGGGATLATLLLMTPLAPQTSLALICCGGGLVMWTLARGLAERADSGA